MLLNLLVLPTILLSALFFLVGSTLEREASSRTNRAWLFIVAFGLATPGALFVLYYFHLFDNAAWFYNLRALRFTELAASGLGLAVGVIHSWLRPDSVGEKVAAPSILLALVLIPHVKPLLEPIDLSPLRESCDDAICLQTTESTCGPASAVAILRSLGYAASEKQLATECFTYRGGTESWYLARAFARRDLDARVIFQPPDHIPVPAPAIAGVILRGGSGHFIAVLSQTASHVMIADPLKGVVVATNADLRKRYRFTGFFLTVQRRDTRRR
jgi:hypothetical protein